MALTTRISDLPAKGSNLGTGDLVPIAEVDAGSPTGYTTKYVTGAEVGGGGGGNTIYTADDTIGTSRTVTIGSDLAFDGGRLNRTNVNLRNIVEVTRATDLPTTLIANTTYIIRGEIPFTNSITINVEGCEIIGLDRNEDHMIWQGAGVFLKVTDVNFGVSNLKFSSTTSGNSILKCENIDGVSYNDGRSKTLRLSNIQFRGTYEVMFIEGFDLVDINNCLFFYIKALTYGCLFRDVSKLQITSCEFIRWFDESTLPTPSGYSTASMITIEPSSFAAGFGAVNINGCIIHPQQTQNGIDIDTTSTTGFGTISSNAFIDVGLTGNMFLPIQGTLPDYSQTATLKYDVFSNQGIANSTSYSMGYFNGLISGSAPATPTLLDVGTAFISTSNQRFTSSNTGIITYNGTKDIQVQILASIAIEANGNDVEAEFSIYKSGALITGSNQISTFRQDREGGNIPLVFLTSLINGDTIEVRAELLGGTSWDLTSYHLSIKE